MIGCALQELCHLNQIEYLFHCFPLLTIFWFCTIIIFFWKQTTEWKETLDNGPPYAFSDSKQTNCNLKSDDNRLGNVPCDTFLPPNCPSNFLTKIYGAMESVELMWQVYVTYKHITVVAFVVPRWRDLFPLTLFNMNRLIIDLFCFILSGNLVLHNHLLLTL